MTATIDFTDPKYSAYSWAKVEVSAYATDYERRFPDNTDYVDGLYVGDEDED